MPPSRYARKSKCRTPFKFYIAPEGTRTEYNYFSNLKRALRLENVEIITIPRPDDRTVTEPNYIFSYASGYCKKHNITPSEYIQISILIDFDRWGEKIFQAKRDAKKKKFNFYYSNPCIELWFVLHDQTFNLNELQNFKTCKELKQKFNTLFNGDYNKLYPLTKIAISNSEKMVSTNNYNWTKDLGTNIHLLFNKIFDHCT